MLDGIASLAMTIRVKKEGELPYLIIPQLRKPSLRSPAGAAAIQPIVMLDGFAPLAMTVVQRNLL
jgi:hypothetical protein